MSTDLENRPTSSLLNAEAAPVPLPAAGGSGGGVLSAPHRPSRFIGGVSGRLLVLTILFVMLAEAMIYLPSVARFRVDYFEAKMELARLAALALLAAPDEMVSEDLQKELLRGVGANRVAMQRQDSRALALSDGSEIPSMPGMVNLDNWRWWMAIYYTLKTLAGDMNSHIRVSGTSPRDPGVKMEIVLPVQPLVHELRAFSWRILTVSLAISGFTAVLVYLSLQWLLVAPMRRLTQSIVGFRAAPEDARQIIRPSRQGDEVGVAERELQAMQQELRQALTQRAHLAQLGVAVSKISHDLRNMLAAAQLVSDRLAQSDDPAVRSAAPRLVDSIDRAIALCAQTLRFGRAEEPPPMPRLVPLHALAEDVAMALGLDAMPEVHWHNQVPKSLRVFADPEQLYRVLLNLMRNAMQALQPDSGKAGGEIRLEAAEKDGAVAIELADTGGGLSDNARLHLFEPFRGGARRGGTGLGLAIARELIRGHGGELELARSGPLGTTFRILLPQAPE